MGTFFGVIHAENAVMLDITTTFNTSYLMLSRMITCMEYDTRE